ncbi:ABC transporter substrate-binding protein [Eoetvoesiella caeni]|uniref:Amino acid/amide ABC transporter substrate-binding protein (HAAT family) n=1 Tax=Eoetvoesiella caeni TaxID=645616 RepID=A0A366HGR2_9BURK|nr:ABC transporter substrate-binding protein [Eoetvoesiella caeni]MCI2807936.1 ABC transporter substrate-binding protein [Eoetvoesiella caeni]NYT54061.1 ABC transporter substrate-binding protein [Eoetvoesiella caeni]RBP41855.1 amino acid/amide ABC transporter substrate-binding protein (HAAT family) [Eoetvoesiella caeni]
MKRTIRAALAVACLATSAVATYAVAAPAAAEPFKIGLIVPMTGPFASTGKQMNAAVQLYMQQHGDTVDGRKIEVIVRDDGGLQPENTKRIAQEMVVQDKVNILAGFGLTPLAFAAAPVATQAKVPMVVMGASTSSVIKKSPYIVRTSQTLPQITTPLADWAAKNPKIKSAITLISDYGPGHDAEKFFVKHFTDGGGKVLESIRVPLQNPDFAPFLQRVRDAKPDVVFVFLPSGPGIGLMKQFKEKGLAEAGIQLIGAGDVLDDDLLPSMGDEALGVVTSQPYSAAHDSPENRAYVAAFEKMPGHKMRPNLMSVGGYDGMHLIYAALKKAGPNASGDQLLAAMKGMNWESPRGPISIDPETRDIIQNVYIRRAEKVKGQIYNVEFITVPNVKDPAA